MITARKHQINKISWFNHYRVDEREYLNYLRLVAFACQQKKNHADCCVYVY